MAFVIFQNSLRFTCYPDIALFRDEQSNSDMSGKSIHVYFQSGPGGDILGWDGNKLECHVGAGAWGKRGEASRSKVGVGFTRGHRADTGGRGRSPAPGQLWLPQE